MQKLNFKCTLLSDLVLSSTSATEGEHRALDFIPGSVFWGLAASNGQYDQLGSNSSTFFHSNDVLFGDAHPAVEGQYTFPVPFTLHHDKTNLNLRWHSYESWPEQVKPKQARSGYYAKGKVLTLSKGFQLRTAIENGRAKDSQMFGYQSLNTGSEWLFSLLLNKENQHVDEQLIIDALSGIKHIGRSRSAQYGLCEISHISSEPISARTLSAGQVLVYCESRCAFKNSYGHPTYQPAPEDLGLPSDSLIRWDKSQIRRVQFELFNGKRQTHDATIYAMEKGSVIYAEVKRDFLTSAEQEGVGEYRNIGLGRVQYNPLWFDDLLKGIPLSTGSGSEKGVHAPIFSSGAPTLAQKTLGSYLKRNTKAEVNLLVEAFTGLESHFKEITKSQWEKLSREIEYYINENSALNGLAANLNGPDGFFHHGTASQVWRKNDRHLKFSHFLEGHSEEDYFTSDNLLALINKLRKNA